MKIKLIQKGNRWAIKSWALGFIPMYLGYDFGGMYGWWFTKDWMNEEQAKRLYDGMMSDEKEDNSFKASQQRVIKAKAV